MTDQSTMALVVENSSFEKMESGDIFGELYFQVGKKSFPNRYWTDFVSVILTWWTEHFLDLLENRLSQVKLRFMEEPHYLEIKQYQDVWDVSLVEDDKVTFTTEVSPDFLNDYVVVIEDVLAYFKAQKWTSKDITKLTQLHAKLVSVLAEK